MQDTSRSMRHSGVPPKLLPLGSTTNCQPMETMPSNNTLRAEPIWNGKSVYVFGGSGYDGKKKKNSDKKKVPIRNAYQLDITSGKWRQLADMRVARRIPAVVPIDDNEILVAGDLKHLEFLFPGFTSVPYKLAISSLIYSK